MAIKHKNAIVYEANTTQFNNKGLGEINGIIEGTIIDEDGKEPTLEMTVSEECRVFDYLIKMNIILADGQLYRIWDTEFDTDSKEKTIFAKHISSDLNTWMLHDKQYKGTFQAIVKAMLNDIKDFPYKYNLGWKMGNYNSKKLEFQVDDGLVIDSIFELIEQFEEENQGVKIEIKRDNFDLSFATFEEKQFDTLDSRATEEIATVYNCKSLNVRKGAGTKYQAIAWLQKGDDVVVLDKTSNRSWVKIRTNKDIIGWVSKRYLTNYRNGSTSDVIQKPNIISLGFGTDTGIRFDRDKIKNVNITEDINDFCTRLIATGSNDLVGTYTAVGGKQGYPFWVCQTMNFNEATTKTELANYAKKYLAQKSINIKNINIEIQEIFGTSLYQNLMFYKDLKVYDWVWVKHPAMDNYYQRFKVVKTERDVRNGKLLRLELGQLLPSFAKRLKKEMDKSFMRNIIDYSANQQNWTSTASTSITTSYKSIKKFDFSTTPQTSNLNLSIAFTTNASAENTIDIQLYLNGVALSGGRHIERVFSGTNIANINIPVNIAKTNTAKKHTLEVKIKGSASMTVSAGNLNINLSGSGLKTNMEYLELADLDEEENIIK